MTSQVLIPLPAMTDDQRASFQASYAAGEKNEVTGVLLAVFLGWIGIHHFYLRRIGLGILYLVFSATGIPWLIALVEAFFMPARVRRYNAELSSYLAAVVTGQVLLPGVAMHPRPSIFCSACGTSTSAGVRYCGHCGAPIAS